MTGATKIAGFCLLLTSCSTTATISDLDRGQIESEIVGADASRLYLDDGRQVDKSRVTDIDHPGNVHLTVGLIMGGTGLLQSGSAFFLDEGRIDNEAVRTQFAFGVTNIIVGGLLAYWGYDTWTTSKRTAESSNATDSMGIKRKTTLP